MVLQFDHTRHAGNHGDVLKHVVWREIIKALQKENPEGIAIVDAFCGQGLYDLGEQTTNQYQYGMMRIIESVKDDSPQCVKEYVNIIKELDSFYQTYPGSAVFADKLLRDGKDELTLIDLEVEDVQGLENEASFIQMDSLDPENIAHLLPETDKHTVILLDPPYKSEDHFLGAKALMERILKLRKDATVVFWYPLIEGSRYRYGWLKMIKDDMKKPVKTGYYAASLTARLKGLVGSAVFIANPTKDFDDVVSEETVDWLSTMLVSEGRSDFLCDMWIKKVKKKK